MMGKRVNVPKMIETRELGAFMEETLGSNHMTPVMSIADAKYWSEVFLTHYSRLFPEDCPNQACQARHLL
jgi:hypothetical protein